MKVKHLIEELQKFDPELPVITEGCDCTGESFEVSLQSWNCDGTVMICRYNGPGIYDNNDPPGCFKERKP